MEQTILEKFDSYQEIIDEIEISRKYGTDYMLERGEVSRYISRIHPPRIDLVINDIIEETPSTKTFRLTSVEAYLPPFQAGQYISIHIETDHIRTNRAYSISSPPCETGHYDITVRRVDDGLVSTYLLDEAKIGDKLTSSGPQGTFLFNPLIHEKTTIFLAGGSGITPFKSMIEEIVSRGLDRTVYLFYGSKSIDDMIFHDRLSQISSKYDNINYVPVIEAPATGYSGETGFITADLLKKRCQTAEKKTLFICGPQGMYNFCLPEIETFGIPKRKARREMFGTPIHIWEQEGWPSKVSKTDEFSVTVNGSDTIKAVAGESLLVSLEKTGHIVPSLCRSGECSKCRVKIVSGKVYQPPGTPVRKSDRQFGYVHSCVSYPLGNLEILL